MGMTSNDLAKAIDLSVKKELKLLILVQEPLNRMRY